MSYQQVVERTNQIMTRPCRAYLLLVLIHRLHSAEECIIPTAALHKLSQQELYTVLPHLVSLVCRLDIPCLASFVEFVCRDEFRVGLMVRWAFEAMLPEHSNKPMFINKIEQWLANGSLQFFDTEVSEEKVIRNCIQKEAKLNALNSISRFCGFVAACSVKLKDCPDEECETRLQKMLQKANTMISVFRAAENGGIFKVGLPFPFPGLGKDDNPLLVKVVLQKLQIFRTKTKVPYRVIFETLDDRERDQAKLLDCTVDVSAYDQQTSFIDPELIAEQMMRDKYTRHSLDISLIKATLVSKRLSTVRTFCGYLDVPADQTIADLKKGSPLNGLKSHNLSAFVVKAGDDLRQEYFALSLVHFMDLLFKEAQCKCWLRPYNITMLSDSSGLVEYLWDTKSIDAIKKICGGCTLTEIYHHQFLDRFAQAQEEFARSLAGYSLVCYIMSVKDRHNGNILIDKEGHVIHIDYGFILDTSPASAGFETAPFKLTKEYVDLMGGPDGRNYKLFKSLFTEGLMILAKASDSILGLCRLFAKVPGMPCGQFSEEWLMTRLCVGESEKRIKQQAGELVEQALSSLTTGLYDGFQLITNDIQF